MQTRRSGRKQPSQGSRKKWTVMDKSLRDADAENNLFVVCLTTTNQVVFVLADGAQIFAHAPMLFSTWFAWPRRNIFFSRSRKLFQVTVRVQHFFSADMGYCMVISYKMMRPSIHLQKPRMEIKKTRVISHISS